ncbi:SMP-30/gluconolactonase/LRE family protein [Qipengyuania zhejiangensis]|uniref:SMP-30/gluconolactonase/LRE family protein n=1 Tax=Qipengyuania zhejiangensis TaxID=3077782 RepID=UPI002D776D5B|nr:SMP-30/gluconolactonase/LRE family protein [Qipengyuania sp. Z2]
MPDAAVTPAETVATGIYFGEGPRWHVDDRGGRLWFSDFFARRVYSMDSAGALTTELELDEAPSGLGWMPDGSLLVVKMDAREVWRRFPDGRFERHADLGGHSAFKCNDMVVDAQGRAYVGNFGFDLDHEISARGVASVLADHPTTPIALVYPDGTVVSAAGDETFGFPNGSVISPDGRIFIAAETLAGRLTSFRIKRDGTLVDRQTWADVLPRVPDGICLDQSGAVWVANPTAPECVRYAKGGAILETVSTGNLNAYACMLGGEDGRDLFVCVAPTSAASEAAVEARGQIMRARVEVARAGKP